jgi:excinuclease ABC subunit C
MKDAGGEIIYVGKAINLQKRVASYFQRQDAHGAKTALMVARVADIETVVTASEKEALILESNLIKRHRPRFNVVLKDDKRYPSIRIDINAPYPKIEIVRKTPKDGAVYFGPFSSAHAVRQTVKLINKTFPLRKCSDRTLSHRNRPCIHHQMGQCLAPCCLPVDMRVYRGIVKEVILFLKGRTPELIKRVRRQMLKASAKQEFETAAVLRDRMVALEKTLERQVTVTTDFLDRDVIGITGSSDFRLVTVMTIRRGFLQGVRHFEIVHAATEKGELVAQFLAQYYQQAHGIPVEVLVPELPDNNALLEETLSEWRQRRVKVRHPSGVKNDGFSKWLKTTQKTSFASESRKRPGKAPSSRPSNDGFAWIAYPHVSSASTIPIWPARIRCLPWWSLSMAVHSRPAIDVSAFVRYLPRTIMQAWPKCYPEGMERSVNPTLSRICCWWTAEKGR